MLFENPHIMNVRVFFQHLFLADLLTLMSILVKIHLVILCLNNYKW